MFTKTINTNDRNEMINFLKNHFRYDTMRGWNNATSYANDVKIHHLGLDKEMLDKAFDFIGAEYEEFQIDYSDLLAEFENHTGYSAEINGRSGGYLVLCEIATGKAGIPYVSTRAIDMYADFDEWDDTELKDRVELVTKFDKFCDAVVDLFKYYLENTTIEKVEYVVKHEKTVAKLKEN